MTNVAPAELRVQLEGFVRYRREHLTGDEKGEAQVYCERLFRAFGHEGLHEAGATLEMRLKKNNAKGTAFADLVWKPRCLIEMKKAGTDLSRHYRQAFDYWVQAVPDRPRYVILCNFDELWVYDFDRQLDAPVDRVRLDELPTRSEGLAFMLPEPAEPIFGNDLVAVTRDAAAKVARVFREIHDRGIERLKAQRFVLQSVIAMFSEDIGLLPAKHFTRALTDSDTGSEAYDLTRCPRINLVGHRCPDATRRRVVVGSEHQPQDDLSGPDAGRDQGLRARPRGPSGIDPSGRRIGRVHLSLPRRR